MKLFTSMKRFFRRAKTDILFVDTLRPGKKAQTDLRKREFEIRITLSSVKQRTKNAIFFSGIGVLILGVLLVSIAPFSSNASIVTLYPSSCLGGWEHSERAAGEPDATEDTFQDRAALVHNSTADIFCGGFSGEYPQGALPETVTINFSLHLSDTKLETQTEESTPETVEESSEETIDEVSEAEDSVPEEEPTETSTPEEVPEEDEDVSEASVIEASGTEESEAEESSEVRESQETVFNNLFRINRARAQEPDVVEDEEPAPEEVSTDQEDVEVVSEEEPVPAEETPDETIDEEVSEAEDSVPEEESVETSTPEEVPEEDEDVSEASTEVSTELFRVSYTIDGATWHPIGNILRSNWKAASMTLPPNVVKSWNDLENIQISLQPTLTYDEQPYIYLDSMWLDVSYDGAPVERANIDEETAQQLPRVHVPADVSHDQKNFKANESPRFQFEISNELLEQPVPEEASPPIDDTELSSPEEEEASPPPEESVSEETHVRSPVNLSTKQAILHFFHRLIPKAKAQATQFEVLDVTVVDPLLGERLDIQPIISRNGTSLSVEIPKPNSIFVPGKYRLSVELFTGDRIVVLEEEFTWGVLAVNLNKSIYRPGAEAYVQLSALDDKGNNLCFANLAVTVTTPGGTEKIFTTDGGGISLSGDCGYNNVTNTPDYFFYYTLGGAGEYQITFENLDNGYHIEDSFEVRTDVPYDISRISATRINPFKAAYDMTAEITAGEDFRGAIVESIPDSFEIIEHNADEVVVWQGVQLLVWQRNLASGDHIVLKYQYQAPKISPQFYLVGPLGLYDVNTFSTSVLNKEKRRVFQEARQWQIASDAAAYVNSWSAAVRNASTVSTGSQTVSVGNLLVLICGVADSRTISLTSGFTNIRDDSGNTPSMRTMYRIADSTSQDFSCSWTGGNSNGNVIGLEYSGVDTSNPLNNSNTNSGSGTTVTWTALDPGSNNYVYVAAGHVNADTTFDSWTNSFNERQDVNTGTGPGGARVATAASDKIATGSQSTAATVGSGAWRAQMIAFNEFVPTITISGTIYTDYTGSTPIDCSTSKTVSIKVNGTGSVYSAECSNSPSNGSYSIDIPTPSAGSVLTIYMDGETEKGNAVFISDGTAAAAYPIYLDAVHVRNDNSGDTTIDNLDVWDKDDDSTNLRFTATNGSPDTLVVDDGFVFYPSGGSGGTFTPGGNVTVDDIHIVSYVATGTETITVSGSWNVASSNFTPASSTVIFDATSGTETIDAYSLGSAKPFHNVILGSGSGTATWTLTDTLFDVDGDLTVNFGTLDQNTNDIAIDLEGDLTIGASGTLDASSTDSVSILTIAGSWDNSGTLIPNGGSITFDSSGTETIDSTGASSGAFFKVYFLNSSGTWNLNSDFDVNDDLQLSSGTLSQGVYNITVAGGIAIQANGVFTSGSGTFTFDGSNTDTWQNSGTLDDLGEVIIDGTTSRVINTGGAVQATSLTVGSDDTFNLGVSGNLYLSGSGIGLSRPLIVNGSFSAGASSIVHYLGTSNTEIENLTYSRLNFTPASGSQTYTLQSGTLDIDDWWTMTGSTSLTVDGNTNDTVIDVEGDIIINTNTNLSAPPASSFTIAGSWDNNGTFTHNSGTVTFDATSGTESIDSTGASTATFNDLILGSGSGTATWDIASALDVDGDLTVSFGTLDQNTSDQAVDLEGDFTIGGSGIATLSNTANFNIAGSWDNNGDFNSVSGTTVIFDATSGTEFIDSTGATDADFFNIIFGSGSGTATWTVNGTDELLNLTGDLTIAYGTLSPGVNYIDVGGNLDIQANGNFTAGSADFTFDGSGSVTWNNAGSIDDMGSVIINGVSKTVTLISSVQATSVNVDTADDTLSLGSAGYTLTLTGSGTGLSRPLIVDGTLTEGTDSEVVYAGTSATEIENETYHDLDFTPASGTQTYTLQHDGGLDIDGNWTMTGSTALTVDVSTNDPAIDVEGDVTIGSNVTFNASNSGGVFTIGGSWTNNGTFTHNSGEVTFDTTTTASISGNNTWYDFTVPVSAAGKVIEFEATTTQTFTSGGALSVTGASGNLTHIHSSSTSSQWLADFKAAQSGTITYAHIDDSGCAVGSSSMTLDGTTGDNGDNGSCWIFSSTPDLTWESNAGWYDQNWSNRVKVTIQSSQVGSTLTNFPVYVDLSDLPAGFHTNVKSDGGDIRVTKANGTTEVAREVVFYDAGTDTGELYFLADSISSSANTDFYIYYGNSGASDHAVTATFGRNNVWAAYDAVYHFNETSGTDVFSSTGTNDATVTGATLNQTGLFGKAYTYSGVDNNDFVELPSALKLTSAMTVSVWFNHVDPWPSTSGDRVTVFGGEGGSASGRGGIAVWHRWATNGIIMDIFGAFDSGGGDRKNATWPDPAAAPGNWHFVFMSWPGGAADDLFARLDDTSATGTAQNETFISDAINWDFSTNFRIGGINTSGKSPDFEGTIDEFRIRSSDLGADWASAEYTNQNTTTTFYNVGSQETSSPGVSFEIYESSSTTWDAGTLVCSANLTDTNASTVNCDTGAIDPSTQYRVQIDLANVGSASAQMQGAAEFVDHVGVKGGWAGTSPTLGSCVFNDSDADNSGTPTCAVAFNGNDVRITNSAVAGNEVVIASTSGSEGFAYLITTDADTASDATSYMNASIASDTEDSSKIDVSAAQSLSFSISDNAIGFGTLTSASVYYCTADGTGSTSEPGADNPTKLTASTNAGNGLTISIKSANAALKSGANTINSTASTAVSAGSEGYGAYVKNVSVLTAGEGFDNDGVSDVALTTGNQTLLSTTGPTGTGSADLSFKAGVAALTEAGSYSDTITLTVTANY